MKERTTTKEKTPANTHKNKQDEQYLELQVFTHIYTHRKS